MADYKKNTRTKQAILSNQLGKLPPQALELEEAVLGALMIEKEALNVVIDILRPESFYKPANQFVYESIYELFSESEPIDMLTVTQRLRRNGKLEMAGGASYIMRLTNNVQSSANIEYHARLITEQAIKRDLITIASQLQTMAFEDSTDVFDLLDQAESQLFSISEHNIRKGVSKMDSLVRQAIKEISDKKDIEDGLTGIPSGFNALDRVTAGWQRSDLVILAARPAMGKCLGIDTPVLMYDGSIRKVQDIEVGDLLMGDDSTPRTVLSLARGQEKMYWIRQNRAMDYRVNESHILSLKRSRNEGKHKHGDVLDISVQEYLQKSSKFQSNYKGYKVAVNFKERKLPSNPYDLGFSLGKNENIDTPIPKEFLINSTKNRLALLAGLIDSDGYYDPVSNGYEIVQKNKELAKQIEFLCNSLGFRTSFNSKIAKIKKINYQCEVYRVRFYGNTDSIPVRVVRKKSVKWKSKVDWRHTGIKIEEDKVDDYYGFVLDGNHRFLLGDMTVTHNTAFSLSVLRNAAVDFKHPVAFFSLEMSEIQLTNRLISAEAELESDKIKRGNLVAHEWEQLHQRTQRITEAPIFIDDTPALSVLELRAKCRRLKAQHDIQMVVVDYLQLMTAGTSKNMPGNREQEIATISRSLKNLAKELNVPVIALSQLSRAVETRGGDKRPMLSDLRESGCLTGDSLILNAETGQRVPIQTLAEEFKKNKKSNFKVFAIDENYKLVPKKVTNVFYSGRKKVYNLITRTGQSIKASANHPFFKIKGWTRLDKLEVGDKIAVPRNINIQEPSNPISKDELILLAHLIGDGCILPKQSYHYTSADLRNIEIVNKTAKKLFNIEGKVVSQKNWYHTYLKSPAKLTHGKRNPITDWYEDLGLERVRSYEKQLPEALFGCDEKHIATFLHHLWATDGNISWKNGGKNRKKSAAIYYATSSKKLGQQVQELLTRLNIISVLRVAKSAKGYRNMYHINISGVDEQIKFLENIGCHGERGDIIPEMLEALNEIEGNPNFDTIPKEAWQEVITHYKNLQGIGWRAFCKGINTQYCGTALFRSSISRARMQRVYNVLPFTKIANLANSDILWDEIIDIQELGEEDVYDATVEGLHNFVANNIIVHNSIEQDADMVLFLYRPQYYGITQDEEGNSTEGIGEVIIAKHRNGGLDNINLRFVGQFTKFVNLDSEAFNPNGEGFTLPSKINESLQPIPSNINNDNTNQTQNPPSNIPQGDDPPF